MEESTITGNKLIAEFMGWEKSTYHNTPNKMYREKGSSEIGIHISDFKYHSSWDALMPVVEKIRQMHTDRVFSRETLSESADRIFCIHFISARIDIVYNCVIQFIQWYNNQQTQKK